MLSLDTLCFSNPNFALMEPNLALGMVPHVIFITNKYRKHQENCSEYPFEHLVFKKMFSLETLCFSNPNFALMEPNLALGMVPHIIFITNPYRKISRRLFRISFWTPRV